MTRECQLSKKKVLVGNRVSHSKRRSKHCFLPNLKKKRFWSEESRRFFSLRVATSTIRTIDKLGFDAYRLQLKKRKEKNG